MKRHAPVTLICALLLCALSAGGCQVAKVRVIEKSMEPTIASGDLVTIDEDAYDDAAPAPGDIVSVVAPRGADRDLCGVPPPRRAPCPVPARERSAGPRVVKRIVAAPGEQIAIAADGTAIVDGRPVDEPYVLPCMRRRDLCALPRTVRVPPGHWFLLGDNRPYSSDSRAWGPVPTSAIEGRVEPARPQP